MGYGVKWDSVTVGRFLRRPSPCRGVSKYSETLRHTSTRTRTS